MSPKKDISARTSLFSSGMVPLKGWQLYYLLAQYLDLEQEPYSREFPVGFDVARHVNFLWMNRKKHTYDYKFAFNFHMPEIVQKRHVIDYLFAKESTGGLELNGAEALRYVVLRGVQHFAELANAKGKADGERASQRRFQYHDNWRKTVTEVGLWVLGETVLTPNGRRKSVDKVLREYDVAINTIATTHLDDNSNGINQFEKSMRELLCTGPQQPIFTGFLIRALDPLEANSKKLFKAVDLSEFRPWATRTHDTNSITTPYSNFVADVWHLNYTILSMIESYFFGGGHFATRDHPEGEQLYKTCIVGVPLAIGGSSGSRDFLGAAFILGNYPPGAEHQQVEKWLSVNVEFLQKWSGELSRLVSRITRQELRTLLIDLIEREVHLTDYQFLELLVDNIHLISQAYVRFLAWPNICRRMEECKHRCRCIPVNITKKCLDSIASGQEVDYSRYFFEILEDSVISKGGATESMFMSPSEADCLLSCGADTVSANKSPDAFESRRILDEEKDIRPSSGRSLRQPYGPFRAYFPFPIILDNDPPQVLGVMEFFFPVHIPSGEGAESLAELRLKLHELIADLSDIFQIFRAYRRVQCQQSQLERVRIEHTWIQQLTHNIKSGCNLVKTSKILKRPIPQVLCQTLNSTQPLEKKQRNFLIKLIDDYLLARRLLEKGLDTIDLVRNMFISNRHQDWISMYDGLDTLRRITESYATGRATCRIPLEESIGEMRIQLGALQVLWHVLINAIDAASKSKSRQVELKIKQLEEATQLEVVNSFDGPQLTEPDYSAERRLLDLLWESQPAEHLKPYLEVSLTKNDSVKTSFMAPREQPIWSTGNG